MPICLRRFSLVLTLLAVSLAHGQQNVTRLLTELKSPDPAIRDNAAQQLAKSHSPRAIQPLIAALNDTNLRVAQDAAFALGQMRAIEAVQPLIDSLHHSYCSGVVGSNSKAPAALAAIGMPAVPAMMQALTTTSYGVVGDISFELAPALDAIKSSEIVPPLVALLQSPNHSTRIYAEERLASHPGRATVDALLPMLNDPDKYVRSQAARALGKNATDPRVIPALRDIVEEPANAKDNGTPQISAIRVLGEQHDPALIPVLIEGLQYPDIGLNEASTALLALGPVAIDPLIAALADTTRPAEARYWAAITLGQFQSQSDAPRIVSALLAASHDAKRRVREGAFTSKVANTSPAFTDRLLNALSEDTYWRNRQLSGYSLVSHNDPRVNPALIAALKDRDENVRAAAADSLGKRRATEAVDPLIAYMGGKSTLDHQQAALALGAIGDARAIEPLINVLRDKAALQGDCYPVGDALVALNNKLHDPTLVPHLRDALAQRGSSHCGRALSLLSSDPGSVNLLSSNLGEDRRGLGAPLYEALDGSKGSAAVEPLIAALNSPDPRAREHAAEVLSANQKPGAVDPRAIEPLIKALDDPDQEVRRRAAIALINVDDPRKIEPFARLLRSTDFALREYAAVGLGQVHDPRAVAALISALNDPDFNTNRGLMNALQHNTYAPVLPALLTALRSPSPVVRASATEALRYRTESTVSKALIPLEHDSDPHVRAAAKEALSGCPVPPLMD